MEQRISLAPSVREKIIPLLAPALAGATDLMLSCKEAHWNVKGPAFIAVHELFDKFVLQAAEYADKLAERIVQLGGHAHGELRSVAQASPLGPYPKDLRASADHIKALADQTAALGAITRKGIDAAAEVGDQASADLFTELTRGLDLQLWFLEAHLG